MRQFRGSSVTRQRRCVVVAVVLAFIGVGIPTAVASMPQEAFDRMPASTVAAVATNHMKQAQTHIDSTGVVQAFKGDAFEPLRRAIGGEMEGIDLWVRDFPLPREESEKLLDDRCFALVMVETREQLPELCFLVETGDMTEAWIGLIETVINQSADKGLQIERSKRGTYDLWTVSASDDSSPFAIMNLDGWLVVGETVQSVTSWIPDGDAGTGAQAGANRLTGKESYTQTIGTLTKKHEARGDLWFYLDPLRLDYLSSRLGGQELNDFSETFGARHGFDEIKAIGGFADFSYGSNDAAYHLKIWAPGPRDQGMKLLGWRPMETPSPASWVPQGVSTCVTMDWDLQPMLSTVGPMVDEVVRETTGTSEKTFATILEDVRNDLEIDLEKDFMPLLSGRIEYVSIFSPPASETAEQSIVALEIARNADDAEVADLLFSLIEGDSNNYPFTIPGFPFELWKLGIGRRAGDSGPSFSTPGVMVAHRRLFFASSYESLRNYVAINAPDKSIAADDEFSELSSTIAAVAGDKPAIRIIAFPALDFQNTYELLRTGRTENAESLYMTVLNPLLEASDTELPFQLLPSFDVIKDQLGPACIQINSVDDGWELWGLNIRAGHDTAAEKR